MLLFLVSLWPVIVLSGDERGCDGIEYCRLPKIDASKDCPTYGFDCSSTSMMMQFNLSVDRGHSILTCRDKTAKLFVKQTAREQLKCEDGKWSYGSVKTKHALCAKPCDSCSVEVPNYVTTPSVSASLSGATNSENPCAIAVCEHGTHLLGVFDNNETAIKIPEKHLKCTGTGWTDKAGNKYDHAICGYYSDCSTPTPLTSVTPDPIFGPPQPVNVSHGAVFCPPGYQLVFSEALPGTVTTAHYTMYPIICSSSGTWQLLTVDIQGALEAACVLQCGACDLTRIQSQCHKHDKRCRSAKLETVTNITLNSAICAKSPVCNDINYVPVFSVGSSDVTTIGVCNATSIVTSTLDTISAAQCVRYSCKKDYDDIPDINSLACPNRTIASCHRANVHSSRITCPCGWQLVYATSDGPTTALQTEHLTCAASGSTMFWDSSNSTMNTPVTVIGASCRRFNAPCLRCPPLKPLFAFHDQVFEYPAYSKYKPAQLSITGGCQQLSCTESALFYNSLDTVTSALTCGEDLQWHATDGTIAHTASCIPQSSICIPLDYVPDGSAFSLADIAGCEAVGDMQYELNGDTVLLGPEAAYCCAGHYFYNYTTLIPNGAKFRCV